ncbi:MULTISPECIES: NUDIX hydrolase [Paenibacillus]|uniref:NTP pyrophosphohydrolase n=1 Tax=Paenibacillus campinasensis TaxID=66347 RepID=A0A268F4P3_9BACL|nr:MULTISPECIES: NUDIX domain-containing protein [Paenibacillus]PAD80314.1 NTP pyrophosphohydrolase [Paenibacillus campinasensis]PAK55297.1 NTP pyrophosphohydrolase [Paenibacillus sp. 7541]
MTRKEISAGGVVYRYHEGELQIQLIQDRYGKTSLPKGKMEPGETVEQTALREIVEETGIVGRIITRVDIIPYKYNHPEYGIVDKEVHYYLVEAVQGTLKPQLEEINGVDWHAPLEAWNKQRRNGYNNNDVILRKALELLQVNIPR